jgi:cell division protein FtsW
MMAAEQIPPRRRVHPDDSSLLFPVLFLVLFGLVMVYSASCAVALKKFGNEFYFVKRQAVFALVGMAALVVCRRFPYGYFRPLAYPLLLASLGLLIALLLGPGYEAGGSTRWLRVAGFSFQPSEPARLAMVIYLAYSMNKKSEAMGQLAVGFIPHVLVLGVFVALIMLQPDFGSAVILTALTWIMLFIGGAKLWHLCSAFVPMAALTVFILIQAPYRVKRVLSFLDPWQYPADIGYQTIHSLMAFGTGGLWGAGLGKGYQKLFYLPESHTDFIFSVIGEELGLVGVMGIVALYAVIIWKGFAIARETRDRFGAYLAAGIASIIGLQACVNMGVTLGLLPPKGLTLPFLSYGGTSLLFSMASVGILLNIGGTK